MARIRKPPSDWQRTLAHALGAWCQTNKVTKVQLAKKLDVPVSIADNMLRGRTIVETVHDAYARLFELTGLSAADPRGPIPPRVSSFSKDGKKERRWSDQMWADWHKSAIYHEWKAKSGTMSGMPMQVGQKASEDGRDILVRLTGGRIKELRELLSSGTRESREQIVREYGMELEELQNLLNAYAQSDAREDILMLTEATRG